ncbi:MAG: 3'-5' exonuclease [Myxococcales bacterium]|nr:3'-5' exonuclease [Myxococcales bacterium]
MLLKRWRNIPFVAVDVETTGLSAEDDRVIEVGIVRFVNGEVVDRYGQIVDPVRSIPDEVVALTGIKQQDVNGMPRFVDIADDVLSRLSGSVIVAYNLSFDRSFLAAELSRSGASWPADVPCIDPLIFARQLHKNQGSKKLGAVAARMGIPLVNAHRAVDDAEVAGKVLLAFADQLPQELGHLLELQTQWEELANVEQAAWRRNKSSGGDDPFRRSGANTTRVAGELPALGPMYAWGEETDPIRAMFMSLPDANTRRAR